MRVPLGLVLLSAVSAWSCETDLDCSLNGACSDAGVCDCDAPWTGRACGVLKRHPGLNDSAHPLGCAYGCSPNVTSWGASIVRGDEAPPKYHMFVAEVAQGMYYWGNQSSCVHAVASSPAGPFVRADVVLGAECHGPVAIRDPSDGAWLLFHQGSGPTGSNSSAFLRTAPAPGGPWTAIPATPGRPGDDKHPCGMPSAAFHPNGTLFAVCGNGAVLRSAPSRNGPWSQLKVRLPLADHWEDPTLYFDRNGNFHIINHVYSLAPFASGQYKVASGHMYSRDGLEWHRAADAPFDGTMGFSDGTATVFATRERPQLVFADAARTTPCGLTNAASSQPLGGMCDSCREGACSQCKTTAGRDWCFTVFQGLKTGK